MVKKIKMIIRSKAPFRVSFGGGGTDMAPYCVDHGGCVISTAIDRHAHVSISPRQDEIINVYSPDFNKNLSFKLGDDDYSGDFELFKGVVNVLKVPEGFDIITHSELPPGSGMGGSSSLAVALIGAFNEYYDYGLSPHDIAQKACDIERADGVLGVVVGERCKAFSRHARNRGPRADLLDGVCRNAGERLVS